MENEGRAALFSILHFPLPSPICVDPAIDRPFGDWPSMSDNEAARRDDAAWFIATLYQAP
jgi:hypothetical protein